jgi:hypothetical protein
MGWRDLNIRLFSHDTSFRRAAAIVPLPARAIAFLVAHGHRELPGKAQFVAFWLQIEIRSVA